MDSIQDILTHELATLEKEITSRHQQAGQVASGKTRASFAHFIKGGYTGILEGAIYSGVLERGRRPGKVPFKFTDIIKRWAIAKGITFSTKSDFNRWAYFVAQKIKNEGTRLYRSGQTEDIFSTPIDEFSDRLLKKVSTYFEAEIENEIFKK